MIYYQLKKKFFDHNSGDLFTANEIKRHKTDKTYPTTSHCRVISTSTSNTKTDAPNCKAKHRTIVDAHEVRIITEKGGEYNL